VAYWRASEEQYVDPQGRPWTAPPGAALALTRDGQPLALVVRPGRASAPGEHSPPGELLDHLGPAARLAIDNERLGAEALAELADLRASRMRIVDAADGARMRLERDLHDGAQQRLLALSHELRLAYSEARPTSAPVLADLADQVAATIEDVRDLAHGIFPAELEESGLEAALELLADDAPVPVQIDVDGEPPAPVARAVYVLVRSAVEAAHEGPVRVTVRRAGATVHVEVDGTVPPDLEYCADRVGALGGTLTAAPRRLTAEVPCG
jgi:signal transduction histidine kinase